MSEAAEVGALSAEDRLVVTEWLHTYLHWHLSTWSEAAGLEWTPAAIDAHIRRHDLAGRDWAELVESGRDPQRLVCTLRVDGRLIGIVYAKTRIDPFLEIPLGVLAWIYVLPDLRGRGYGRQLMEEAARWMRDRSLTAAELMVTGGNNPAIALYESSGYRLVDHRMLAALASDPGAAP